MPDYKATLRLPQTEFPMRADLPKREPRQLAQWREANLYGQIQTARAGTEKFVLHDGPPFANGDAHMGHALNLVLKDIVLKVQSMRGRQAPFVPGWDCHGLPIEHKVMKELGGVEGDPVRIRARCEAEARRWVEIQGAQFERLGVFGAWERPYLTMDPAYEAATLRVFATLVGRDLVYQGLRPVLWSTGCQTALAEAEIEYQERVDPAIYVKFALAPAAIATRPELAGAALAIWTTTPWTLPANLAVAVSPKLDYGVYEVGGERLILATALAANVARQLVSPEGPELAPRFLAGPWTGLELVGLTYEHPFLADARVRPVLAGDFVTAEAGTGLVHIATGHGQDDYRLGQQHGLPVFAPVDDRGCLTAEAGVPALTGVYFLKANPLVSKLLREKGALLAEHPYAHAYPHCWRSKTPIVFRATNQWFVRIDAFRAQALAAIDQVEWIPESARNRIRGTVENRPDWCISRQRTWGIPLPVFYGEGGQPLLQEERVRRFADLVEQQGGAGIWFRRTADELAAALGLPLGLRKGEDTLDVWLDSGTSWAAVLERKENGLAFPADLYLEGSDQHRGWFQSSLLTAVAATGTAPYRAVLTNGFVVDLEGKKLSKSNSGYQKPVDLMTLVEEHGADVLRLWVASQDYQDDIPFSKDILARVSDSYRSLRNTLRILLGNLADFDPERHAAPRESWTPLDAYMQGQFSELVGKVITRFRAYDFAEVYQLLNRFCAVELSAFYIDILKDRLYCHAANDPARRAAQTVLHQIASGLIRLLAPIIPFTAEEAWQALAPGESVHLALFPDAAAPPEIASSLTVRPDWIYLIALRSQVNEALEKARRDGVIGKSLEAQVELIISPKLRRNLLPESVLEELFIVSKVIIRPGEAETVSVTCAADHGLQKCVRCWRYYPELGRDPNHPELCARCTEAVRQFDADAAAKA